MLKARLALVLFAVLPLALLAGCSSNADSSSASPAPAGAKPAAATAGGAGGDGAAVGNNETAKIQRFKRPGG